MRSGAALQNVYTLEMQPEKPLEEEIDKALNRQTSEDDTHPSPVDRFRLYGLRSSDCRIQARYLLYASWIQLESERHFARVEKLREQADPDVRNTIAAR